MWNITTDWNLSLLIRLIWLIFNQQNAKCLSCLLLFFFCFVSFCWWYFMEKSDLSWNNDKIPHYKRHLRLLPSENKQNIKLFCERARARPTVNVCFVLYWWRKKKEKHFEHKSRKYHLISIGFQNIKMLL